MPSIHSARRTEPSPFFARGVMHSVLNSSQQSSSLGDIFAALTVQYMPLRALSVEQALYVAQTLELSQCRHSAFSWHDAVEDYWDHHGGILINVGSGRSCSVRKAATIDDSCMNITLLYRIKTWLQQKRAGVHASVNVGLQPMLTELPNDISTE